MNTWPGRPPGADVSTNDSDALLPPPMVSPSPGDSSTLVPFAGPTASPVTRSRTCTRPLLAPACWVPYTTSGRAPRVIRGVVRTPWLGASVTVQLDGSAPVEGSPSAKLERPGPPPNIGHDAAEAACATPSASIIVRAAPSAPLVRPCIDVLPLPLVQARASRVENPSTRATRHGWRSPRAPADGHRTTTSRSVRAAGQTAPSEPRTAPANRVTVRVWWGRRACGGPRA